MEDTTEKNFIQTYLTKDNIAILSVFSFIISFIWNFFYFNGLGCEYTSFPFTMSDIYMSFVEWIFYVLTVALLLSFLIFISPKINDFIISKISNTTVIKILGREINDNYRFIIYPLLFIVAFSSTAYVQGYTMRSSQPQSTIILKDSSGTNLTGNILYLDKGALIVTYEKITFIPHSKIQQITMGNQNNKNLK